MRKIIIIYILMIISIAGLAFLINAPMGIFSFLEFQQKLHIIVEGTNSLLMLLIFLVANHLYCKTNDERLAILAGGFLVGFIFNVIPIITVRTFPYDLLSLANIQNNPTIVYLFFSNLILPLAIYFTLIHKPSTPGAYSFRFKIYSIYTFIFLALMIVPLLINYFPLNLIYDFDMIIHSFEFINYSLYIMLAFMVINIRQSSNIKFFPTFTLGLVISGLGGLFYINSSVLPDNEILAHVFEAIGLIFILVGIKSLQAYAVFLRFKDELVAYLCLMLIVFYIIFVSTASILFRISFPPFSAFIFVEFILIFQFIVYLIANKVTQPITNIIEALNNYVPGEAPLAIPVIRKDEIGLLTEKINATAKLSREKILEVSRMAERERSIRRIFESMRRVSDPNTIKDTIINEISKSFNPDRCFIALYDPANTSFYFDKYAENLPSKTLLDGESEEDKNNDLILKQFDDLFVNNLEICFENIEDYVKKKSLQGTPKEKLLREYNIKSCCNIPIYYANNLLGYVVLQYVNEYKRFDEEELSYLKIVATQIGITINQAHS